jgi:hypothetical protein
MSKSVASVKPTRVQKTCILWTHDENFSRDDIVFNSDKFPELPTAPGSLLQLVAFNVGTAVRDFSSTAKPPQSDAAHSRPDTAAKDASADSRSKRSRRASFTVTVDENGSAVPGGRDVDGEKTYIFAPKPLPPELKSKHANLHVSISEKIGRVFGFRNRMQVVISEVSSAIACIQPCSAADDPRPTRTDTRLTMSNSFFVTNILHVQTCGEWRSRS